MAASKWRLGRKPKEGQLTIRYNCSRCLTRKERYRAVGNIPYYGHLCETCYNTIEGPGATVKVHYQDLGALGAITSQDSIPDNNETSVETSLHESPSLPRKASS